MSQNQAMAKSVLIVDDHPSFRVSARRMLEAAGYDVVGEAEDGAAAIEAARRLRPEAVLLDVRLPDVDGFEVARRMLDLPGQDLQIVLTSSHESADLGDAIDKSGARGFVPKAELSGSAVTAALG